MSVSEWGGEAVGLPEEFLTRMKRLLGAEYPEFLKSYEAGRTFGLRFNTLKGDLKVMESRHRGTFGLDPVPWCREGFYYDESTRPGRHPYHEAGVYYLQEPSAMAVVSLLDPKPGDRVLDLCAAPGGKTTHIAERLCGEGLLVSNEIHPARAKILSQNVERMGAEQVIVMNEDPARLSGSFPLFFDKIVVDAPCSGEGMFRKDEQARAQWSTEHVLGCVRMQREILKQAAGMLKPGGRLVYSTCTFSPEENERNVEWFLEHDPEFSLISQPDAWAEMGLSQGEPGWGTGDTDLVAKTVRIWPHRVRGEGHFLALFEKNPALSALSSGSEKKEKGRRKKPQTAGFTVDREGIGLLEDFFDEILTESGKKRWGQHGGCDRECLISFGEQIYRLPRQSFDFSGLRILRPGLHLGTRKKKRFEPSHALALALRADDVRSVADYPAESREIAAYLAGSPLPTAGDLCGWTLICVDGYSLGWAKASGGILKNHYPKGLRIPTSL
ncbi:MAG: RsmB/NOP family class I SAM-dependent RNA methyltransferase [Clostridiales bacterium]|nr:RsmB/NOP family class I SAM-dependent RNA methyltransferase [Clostridiales bacterium]